MPYTITQQILNPEPGREWAHKTINDDGSVTITYGPTPDPKDATDLGSKTSAAKPEPKSKAESKTKPTVNSAVKGAAKPATKPLSKLDLVPNMGEGVVSRIKSKFTDSPLRPMNVFTNPYMMAMGFGLNSNSGPMPLGKNTVDKLRIQHGKDELSNQGTNVPINPQGTQYLDPALGIVDTQVLEDEDGIRYYRNAQTGQFDPLDSFKDTHISADQLARDNIAKAKVANFNKTADYLNDIISGVIKHTPQDISKLPPLSTDTPKVANTPVARTIKSAPRAVVQNTSLSNITPSVQTPVVNTSAPVSVPTLSSVTSQAVRHNGGFDEYRRQSALAALRAAGGISPAEAVQRGIIPWEALNYV